MAVPTYSLAELAKLADVTPRTIRYYIAQGLLPAPDAQGPNTRYADEHLARLRAIKKLQAAHLPLADIRQQLRVMGPEQVSKLAESQASAPSDALDYIQNVFLRQTYESAHPAPAPAAAAPAPAPALQTPPPPPQLSSQPDARSQWERISLDPDIELHVRRPLTRQHNKRVERLIAIARELFEED